MKVRLSLALATLMTLGITSLEPFSGVKAATFDEQTLDQTKMVAIARPYGGNKYDLLVLEQIPGKKQCWRENGSNPVMVDPLLLQFDFTGICRRATDSNGYSIRLDGRDFGLDYILRVVERGGELVLVGTPRDSRRPELVVGRTRGMQQGFMKIILEPGWQFSRRAFQGKSLGHFYFSGKEAEILAAAGKTPPVVPTTPSTSGGASFGDIGGDIYRSEIERAVAMGFVAGFKEDNTFRPEAPVTREQFVSMIIGGMGTVTKINFDTVSPGATFSDVAADRWSAKRIGWARANSIIAGKEGGNFRPTDPVTRAEMIAILRQAAVYLKTQKKLSPELRETKKPIAFSDLSGHWGAGVIEQMSGFCGVASPLNERGTAFVPNSPAYRNYAAAAIVRTIDCVKGQKK